MECVKFKVLSTQEKIDKMLLRIYEWQLAHPHLCTPEQLLKFNLKENRDEQETSNARAD
jgi:hypothetical protein